MKRKILWIFLAGVILGIAIHGGYKHFTTAQTQDGGSGMENPETISAMDGEYTYVDNSILWPVLEGTWESGDGRWQAVLSENTGLTLTMDGETVLNDTLSFTYLQPGKVTQTELWPGSVVLQTPDGTALGEIISFCHEAAEAGSGALLLQLETQDGTEETIKLQKTEE